MLVSATLAKLGEAGFNSFLDTFEPSDVTSPLKGYGKIFDAPSLSVLVFIFYFLLVLSRHLGAIYSTQIILAVDPRIVWRETAKARFLPILDFVATFLMFMAHYVAAYGLSVTVQSDKLALGEWPIPVVPYLLAALLLDIVVCIVGIVTSKIAQGVVTDEAARELRYSNTCWLVASGLEFALLSSCMYIVSAGQGPTVLIVIAIAVAVVDLWGTWNYWSRIALIRREP